MVSTLKMIWRISKKRRQKKLFQAFLQIVYINLKVLGTGFKCTYVKFFRKIDRKFVYKICLIALILVTCWQWYHCEKKNNHWLNMECKHGFLFGRCFRWENKMGSFFGVEYYLVLEISKVFCHLWKLRHND